jgi:hypothetical protein
VVPIHQEPFQEVDFNDGNMYLTNKPWHWSLVEMNWLLAKGAGVSLQYKGGRCRSASKLWNTS